MKVIAGDHIEAMLEELRNLTCFPNPKGRTFREVIEAHTVDMPDVVERKLIEKYRERAARELLFKRRINGLPSWKPEDSK